MRPRKWRRPEFQGLPTAGDGFTANVHAAIVQAEANLPGAIRGEDPEFLHQLRVGMRRLRSTLRSFRKLVRRQQADAFDRRIRRLLRALGATRDWDVFLKSDWAADLKAEAERRQAVARAAAHEVMRARTFRQTLQATRGWALTKPWRRRADPAQSLAAFAAGALHRLHRQLKESAAGIDWSVAQRRHKVRIRVKRMRYGSECFAATLHERDLGRFLAYLKKLQDILGELNDLVVQKRLLRKLGQGGGRGAAARASIRQLDARERALIGAIAPAWRRFEAHARIWQRAGAARAGG